MEQNKEKKPLGATVYIVVGVAFVLLLLSNVIGDIKSSKIYY
jgi:hypothetical protein